MLLRSGTFKLPTSLPEPLDGIPTVEQQLPSPLLELSDSDSSPSMQSASGHSVEPPQPETLAIMAEAGKNTVTPSKFYGDGREDVDKWLRSFERVAKANQWKEERMAEILPAVLRDRAADFWEDLTEDQQKSYEETKKALKEHFLPPEARRMYHTDLYNRKQGDREPVEDFARAIQDLTRRAHSTMAATEQELLCREHFLHGLRPQLKRLVLVSNPQSFSEAISVAKREEYNDHIVSGSAPWLKPNSDKFYTINTQDSGVNAVVYGQPGGMPAKKNEDGEFLKQMKDLIVSQQEVLSSLVKEMQGNKRQQNQFSANAPRQNFYGAMRRPVQNRNAVTGRNLRTTDGQPICNKCKRVGHIARLCPDQTSVVPKHESLNKSLPNP